MISRLSVLLPLLFISAAASAGVSICRDTFPDAVATYFDPTRINLSEGVVVFEGGAQVLSNPDNRLAVSRIIDSNNVNATCNNVDCVRDDPYKSAVPQVLPAFPDMRGYTATKTLAVNAVEVLNDNGVNEYAEVKLLTGSTLSIYNNGKEFKIRKLVLETNSKLELHPGVYRIDEVVFPTPSSNQQIQPIGPFGQVKLYVNKDLQLPSNVLLNASFYGNQDNISHDPKRLVILGYNRIITGHNTTINGYLYSDNKTSNHVHGGIELYEGTRIFGAVTAQNVKLWDQNHDASNDPVQVTYVDPGTDCLNEDNSSCVTDTMDNMDNWDAYKTAGNFTPQIVNGRLRVTDTGGGESTSVAYKANIPAQNNQLIVEFDQYTYGGSGADGMTIVFSDKGVSPVPGAGGGALGYGTDQGKVGFNGGWLGIGLDEYGNYSPTGGGGCSGRGFAPNSVVIRGSSSGTNGYCYLQGTTVNPPINGNSGGHRYRFTYDSTQPNQALFKLERKVNGVWSTLVNNFNALTASGQAPIPQNFWLSLTGSTGGYTNNHEIDNLSICSRAAVTLQDSAYYRIENDSTGSTCENEPITIKVCKVPFSSNGGCSAWYTEQAQVTLTATNGGTWVDDSGNAVNSYTFSGGTGTAKLKSANIGTTNIGISFNGTDSNPISTAAISCSNNCSLNIQGASGGGEDKLELIHVADSNYTPAKTNLDLIAGKPLQFKVKAIACGQPLTRWDGQTKSIKFWSADVEPSAPVGSDDKVKLKRSTDAEVGIGTSEASGSSLNLTFGSDGTSTTPLTLNYLDAGKLNLNAKYVGAAGGDDAGLELSGSGTFISRPAGICVEINGSCSAADSSCNPYALAGADITTWASGRTWTSDSDTNFCSGTVTDNFTLASNIALTAKVKSPLNLNTGVTAADGTLKVENYQHTGDRTDGKKTITQSFSEVGIFTIQATPPTGGYYGYTIGSSISGPSGRIVPASYVLTSSEVTPAHNGFSYMDQPFGVSFTVEARNMAGVITKNYDSSAGFAFGYGVLEPFDSSGEQILGDRLVDAPSSTARMALASQDWEQGVATRNYTNAAFKRLDVGTVANPDGPYKGLKIGINVVDGETTPWTLLSDRDLPSVLKTHKQLALKSGISQHDMFYGRLTPASRQGPGSAPIAIPLLVEYWEGGDWFKNSDDDETLISIQPSTGDKLSIDTTPCTTVPCVGIVQTSATNIALGEDESEWNAQATATDGRLFINFSAPGAGLRGIVRYDLMGLKPWLSYHWPSGEFAGENGGSGGVAIFGQARGNDRLIYRREAFH